MSKHIKLLISYVIVSGIEYENSNMSLMGTRSLKFLLYKYKPGDIELNITQR